MDKYTLLALQEKFQKYADANERAAIHGKPEEASYYNGKRRAFELVVAEIQERLDQERAA